MTHAHSEGRQLEQHALTWTDKHIHRYTIMQASHTHTHMLVGTNICTQKGKKRRHKHTQVNHTRPQSHCLVTLTLSYLSLSIGEFYTCSTKTVTVSPRASDKVQTSTIWIQRRAFISLIKCFFSSKQIQENRNHLMPNFYLNQQTAVFLRTHITTTPNVSVSH